MILDSFTTGWLMGFLCGLIVMWVIIVWVLARRR